MNLSKHEQRVLHALAQGGMIQLKRDDDGRLESADCWTREGFRLCYGAAALFAQLKRRGFIASRGGGPYRITRQGLAAVRAQCNNR